MSRNLKYLFLFLFLNFGGLAIGAYLQGDIVQDTWYASLTTAPWTPPAWAFGIAWSQIMIFFSIYLMVLVKERGLKNIATLFGICWLLNVSWNPLFFKFHLVLPALVALLLLTIGIFTFFIRNWPTLGKRSMFLMPYLVWLVIASSLNAYVLLNN